MPNSYPSQEIQEEIKRVIKAYRLSFPCPHCQEEINDNHFSKEQRIFQFISEKVRELVEEQFNLRGQTYRQNWLEEIKTSRIYEDFPAFQELRLNLTNLQSQVTKLQSSEYIENLDRVKKLNEELAKSQKETTELRVLLLGQKKSGQKKGEEFEK
ncbi:5055_t:CDS:1 [Racocetra fulgida]|uniref:5055_t:CDS:1 n=1 Tax=Racocetra fulgida TaxID=60492 RepID=A0A9N9I862_9GLOM|nr:5055_t:CDS:1 [Racocetra fulgida]